MEDLSVANTYTALHYHIVFSTENRQPLIGAEVRERIWAFPGGIARENKAKALCVGGTADHIHLLNHGPRSSGSEQNGPAIQGWILQMDS